MKTWVVIAIMLLAALLGALISCIALAFPENIRQGYQSCGNCHVSPTGGGALTGYGRMAGEDMAMFAPEGTGRLLGQISLPDRMAVGGDVRYLSLQTKDYRHDFPMQSDVEMAVRPSNEVWFDAAWGRYGEHHKAESRRNFVLWAPSENLSFRVGRFFPAYGIIVPDHTTATRQGLGFGEGQESYNGEAAVRTKYGELFLTETVSDGSSVELGHDPDYRLSHKNPGYLGRLAVFMGKTAQVGASYRLTTPDDGNWEQTYGPFAMFAVSKQLYMLAEVDRRATRDDHRDVALTELGYEAIRGLHFQLTEEYIDSGRPGVGIQWFPIPHLEALARAKYTQKSWISEFLLHLNW